MKDCSVRAEEEVCRTHYETECWTKTVRNQVDDDVPECLPVVDQKCVEVTEGYTTNQQCSDVTRLKCSIKKQVGGKYCIVLYCTILYCTVGVVEVLPSDGVSTLSCGNLRTCGLWS